MPPRRAMAACRGAARQAGLGEKELEALLEKCREGSGEFTEAERRALAKLAAAMPLDDDQLARLAEMMEQMDPERLARLCRQAGDAQLTSRQIETR